MARQAREMPYFNTFGHSTNVPASILAGQIAELTPGDLNNVFYTTGGSTANWSYRLDNTNPTVNGLARGQMLTDSFIVARPGASKRSTERISGLLQNRATCGHDPALLDRLAASAAAASSAAPADILPARTLRCTLGHALNLDPSREQTLAEIEYEGARPFVLHRPARPRHVGPLPEPSAPPEPVDPATRVVVDPSGLRASVKPGFTRVVDLWPQRVEMVSEMEPPLSHLIISSDIDQALGTANLFMTRAVDAGSLDLQSVYPGPCRVEVARG